MKNYESIVFRFHAVQRMFKRKISDKEVKKALAGGEIIKSYPDDTPLPSFLVLGYAEGRPLHIVAAEDKTNDTLIVITIYEPDPDMWENGFRKRKRS